MGRAALPAYVTPSLPRNRKTLHARRTRACTVSRCAPSAARGFGTAAALQRVGWTRGRPSSGQRTRVKRRACRIAAPPRASRVSNALVNNILVRGGRSLPPPHTHTHTPLPLHTHLFICTHTYLLLHTHTFLPLSCHTHYTIHTPAHVPPPRATTCHTHAPHCTPLHTDLISPSFHIYLHTHALCHTHILHEHRSRSIYLSTANTRHNAHNKTRWRCVAQRQRGIACAHMYHPAAHCALAYRCRRRGTRQAYTAAGSSALCGMLRKWRLGA